MATAVNTLDELRRVTHAPISRSLVHTQAPALRLPAASARELAEWQERLDRELYACGCTSGAVTMLAALAGLAVAQFGLGADLGSGWHAVAVWAVVGLAAAAVGKAAGLLFAQVRRRRLYAEIARTLDGRAAGAAD